MTEIKKSTKKRVNTIFLLLLIFLCGSPCFFVLFQQISIHVLLTTMPIPDGAKIEQPYTEWNGPYIFPPTIVYWVDWPPSEVREYYARAMRSSGWTQTYYTSHDDECVQLYWGNIKWAQLELLDNIAFGKERTLVTIYPFGNCGFTPK